jgi:uncharacterized protein
MKETIQHAPGTFCWPELATSDAVGAKTFYTALFGWGVHDTPAGPDGVYTMFTLDGKELGAAHELMPQQKANGVPPHWLPYIAVANADESVAKAQTLGATVLMGAFDVMDVGRMAILQDPAGAVFTVWQAKNHIGARVVDQAGTLVWTELMSSKADAVRDFYTKLLGWGVQLHDMGPMKYTVFMRGETPAGGMMQITPDMGNVPSHWLSYFGVTDPDATAAKATQLGGTLLIPPADIPNVGRFSVIKDPQGAAFGIIRFDPPAK